MNEEEINTAQQLINDLPENELFSLTELYGEARREILDPRIFGREFKQAVRLTFRTKKNNITFWALFNFSTLKTIH